MKTQILIVTTAMLLANTQGAFSPSSENNGSAKVSAPQNTEFAFFRVHRQGKGAITASWGVTSASGVAGFLVQRTYQDPTDPYSFWEDLSTVVCNPSRSFKYTDSSVFPGLVYYRVVAQMTDGTTVTSTVSGLRILSH
jgi:hypothetical protein